MTLSAVIGAIEFCGDEVRLAIVKTGRRLPALLQVRQAQASYEDPANRAEALVAAVREVLDGVKGRPSAYVLCMPAHDAVVRTLRIPFRGARRVAAAAQFELEPYLAFPIEELSVDFASIREIDGETEVLAVGMRRALLEEQLEILREAGIDPDGINVDAAGLTSLWYAQRRPGAGLHAVLHLRDTGSILAIVWNGNLAFFRTLAATPDSLSENPAAAAREVQNSIRAFSATWQGEDEVVDLSVTGLEFAPGVAEAFEEGLQIPVRYEDLLAVLKGGAAIAREESTLRVPNRWEALAGGAATAAGARFYFEFRKGDLAPPRFAHDVVSHLVFSGCLLAIVALGYAAYCYTDYKRNVAEVDRIGAEVWRLFQEAFPNSPNAKERHRVDPGGATTMTYMAAEIADFNKASLSGGTVPVEMLQRPTLLAILKDLSLRIPGDKATVTEVKIWPSDGRSQAIMVSGDILVQGAFTGILENLRQSELLTFDEEPVLSSKDEKATFRITGHT